MRELMAANHCREAAMGRFEALYFTLLVGCVHEFYRFAEKTTAAQRLQQIIKVAEDSDISKVQWKYLEGLKNKILFVLFRCRLFKVITVIFNVKYGV